MTATLEIWDSIYNLLAQDRWKTRFSGLFPYTKGLLKWHLKHTVLCGAFCLIVLTPTGEGQTAYRDVLGHHRSLKLSFETHGHLILLDVLLEGKIPLKFIFDTGSSHTILFQKALTDYLDISYSDTLHIAGADRSQTLTAYVARNIRLHLSKGAVAHRDILVLDKDYLHLRQRLGTEVHGILGMDLIKTMAIQIEYKYHTIQLYIPEVSTPIDRRYTPYDLHFVGGKPYLRLPVHFTSEQSTPIELELLMDTGAGIGLLLLNHSHPDIRLPEMHIPGFIGSSLGGSVIGYLSRIHKLTLGGLEYQRPPTYFQRLDSTLISNHISNGIIGNRILENYSVILDETQQQLFLRPYRSTPPQYRLDKSGIQLYAIGKHLNSYIVARVIPDSPAARAGIRSGDQILKVYWRPASWYGLVGLYRLLSQKEGKNIQLTLQRNGAKVKVSFQLENLI